LKPPFGGDIDEAPCWHPFLEMLGNTERMPATSYGGSYSNLNRFMGALISEHSCVIRLAALRMSGASRSEWDNFGLYRRSVESRLYASRHAVGRSYESQIRHVCITRCYSRN
jgi:hypothetical protein